MGRGRPRPAAAGRLEPGRERAARDARRRPRDRRRGAGQLTVADTGPGHRRRRPAARVRALLPLRQVRQATGPSGAGSASRSSSSSRGDGRRRARRERPGPGRRSRSRAHGRSFEVSTTSKSEPCSAPSACSWSFDQLRARRARDVPVRAVVGEDHPVASSSPGRRSAPAAAACEMSTLAFSRTRRPIGGSDGSVELARLVARRVDVTCCACAATVKRSAWSIAPGRRVAVPAGEPGQDRQAGGVGGRPVGGPKRVRAEVPDRARAGGPAGCRARCSA